MAVETKTSKKKGLFSRFRKKKDKKEMTEKVEEPTPPPSPEPQEDNPHKSKSETKKSVTKEGIPVITADNPDDFRASDVQKTIPGQPAVTKSKKKRGPRPGTVILDKAPTAREAAFSGPPRYDWIDIETAAAIKVQSAYRRNKVMDELEAQGVSTAAMRNRARRRAARRSTQVSEDTPCLFRCCGVGLAFGDGTEEDYEAARLRDKELYEEKKRAQAEHEAELRKFSHRYKNKKPSTHMLEAVEVVESDEDE
jgi:hypothetical protein